VDLAPGLERCFLFDAIEDSYTIGGITGNIPNWLRGSYYINCPSRFRRGEFRYKHWLDGDGMIAALHFSDDCVRFVSRFVRSRKFREEEAAGVPIYRGFGTAFPGDRLRRNVMLESPVNVCVYPYAGTLLAFGEQTLPIALDPMTLETLGEFDFNGRLNEVSPFAAHAKFDPATGHMGDFGISYSPDHPVLNLYEFDDTGNLLTRRRYVMQAAHSIHDFGFSAQHFVVFTNPQLMDFGAFLQEGLPVYDSLRWQPEQGAQILAVPRDQSRPAFSVRVNCAYCLHFINCFEQDGLLIVDLIELDRPIYAEYLPIPDLFSTAPLGRPVRYRIDLESRTLLDRSSLPYDRVPDFPSIPPHLYSRPYDTFWVLGMGSAGQPGRKFFDQVARCSWSSPGTEDIYEAGYGNYLAGEPVFFANPSAPNEGIIMVQQLIPSEDRVEYLILDAFRLRQGPIATLPLNHPLHPGFHASFRLRSV
jgi:all-trans-8'-apo-beta-carotenal 15,15'-oxygenase